MKLFPVIVIAALIMIAFSFAAAGTASADSPESEVHAQSYPSVTLNVTTSAFYNLTFSGLLLKTQNSIFVTNFNENHWNFIKNNNTSYEYRSKVKLVRSALATDSISPSQDHSQGSGSNAIYADVNISLNALGYSLSNVSIANQTESSHGSYNFPDYSVMEITINMNFRQPIQGPGTLYLLQLIKSSNESKSAVNYYLGNLTHNVTNRLHGEHEGLFIPTSANKISAFYWWNNTFQLNGNTENLTSQVGLKDGGIYIEFAFPFNSTLKTIHQDPFIGVPGNPLFKNPIIQKTVKEIVNYILIHAEFLGTGLAIGVGVLGYTYGIYRRKKF